MNWRYLSSISWIQAVDEHFRYIAKKKNNSFASSLCRQYKNNEARMKKLQTEQITEKRFSLTSSSSSSSSSSVLSPVEKYVLLIIQIRQLQHLQPVSNEISKFIHSSSSSQFASLRQLEKYERQNNIAERWKDGEEMFELTMVELRRKMKINLKEDIHAHCRALIILTNEKINGGVASKQTKSLRQKITKKKTAINDLLRQLNYWEESLTFEEAMASVEPSSQEEISFIGYKKQEDLKRCEEQKIIIIKEMERTMAYFNKQQQQLLQIGLPAKKKLHEITEQAKQAKQLFSSILS